MGYWISCKEGKFASWALQTSHRVWWKFYVVASYSDMAFVKRCIAM